MGLTFELSHLRRWWYTLPIPIAVLAASAGTAAWKLSGIHPVATIERRSWSQ
jgi:hypothetical protein